jgi:hypothetical protein
MRRTASELVRRPSRAMAFRTCGLGAEPLHLRVDTVGDVQLLTDDGATASLEVILSGVGGGG